MSLKKMPQKKRTSSFKKGNKVSKNNKAKKQRSSYDREELLSRKIDNSTITRYLMLNSHLSLEELIQRLDEEYVSSLEAMIIKIMIKGYQTGDVNRANFILDRLVGKVPDHVKHSVANPYEGMSDEELLAEKKRLAIENRKTLELQIEHSPHMKEQHEKARLIRDATPEPDIDSEN